MGQTVSLGDGIRVGVGGVWGSRGEVDGWVDRHWISGTRFFRCSWHSPVGSGVMVMLTTCELEDVMLIMDIFMDTFTV